MLAELLHPNADLGAVFGPGAAAEEAEAAVAGRGLGSGGGGAGAGVVPRLSYLAAAAVRRRLEADIEAAVQVGRGSMDGRARHGAVGVGSAGRMGLCKER